MVVVEYTTNYVPGEDVTIIWQHMYVDGDCIQRALIGWYCGEPDEEATKSFSNMPLIGQFI